MVKFLLSSGANAALATESGLTALMVAAYVNKVEIATLLIDQCDINELNCRGETALHVAARTDSGDEVFHLLLNQLWAFEILKKFYF